MPHKITFMAKQIKRKFTRLLPSGDTLKAMAPGYIKRLKKIPRYAPEDEAISMLFEKTYPTNKNLKEILIKVIALDSSYSTNLRRFSSIKAVADVIKGIHNFDALIQKKDNDRHLVDTICVKVARKGYPRPFSFATKYCCNQNPEKYPIYDSFVAKVLAYYQKEESFLDNSDEHLNKWNEAYKEGGYMSKAEALKHSYNDLFVPVLDKFRANYFPKGISYRDLDHFLWLLGKEFLGEGKPDEIEEVSATIGDYVVVIEEWDSVSIYKLRPNTKDALVECAKKIKYQYSDNMSDEELALSMVHDYSGSEKRLTYAIWQYYISCKEAQAKVYYKVEYGKVKDTLSKINELYPFGFNRKDITRKSGRKCVDYFTKEQNVEKKDKNKKL